MGRGGQDLREAIDGGQKRWLEERGEHHETPAQPLAGVRTRTIILENSSVLPRKAKKPILQLGWVLVLLGVNLREIPAPAHLGKGAGTLRRAPFVVGEGEWKPEGNGRTHGAVQCAGPCDGTVHDLETNERGPHVARWMKHRRFV